MTLIFQAWLNLSRNLRRTLMTVGILAVGSAILFLTHSYLEGMYWALQEGAKRSSGHFQIRGEGAWSGEQESAQILSAGELRQIEAILDTYAEIQTYNKELSFQGIVGNNQGSSISTGIGVELNKARGSLGSVLVTEGSMFFKDDFEAILLGAGLSGKLGLRSGDWVTFLSRTLRGTYNPVSLELRGLIQTGSAENDRYFAAIPLEMAQYFLGTDGVERLLVFLEPGSEERLEDVMAELRTKFAELDLGLELRSWSELADFYWSLKALYDFIFAFLVIVVTSLVFLSVFEIISLAFYERLRELGTLRAIGTYAEEIFLLLIVEVGFLFLIGFILGIGGGLLVGLTVNGSQITWLPPGSSTPVPFLFLIRPEHGLLPGCIVLLASLAAGLGPALKAARNPVAEVLKYE